MKHERDVMAELRKLPKTLNESYQLIYERIMNAGETSQQIAERAMKWLLCSRRRLRPLELIAAIAINPDGEYVSLSERELLDMCCNLLVLDEELKMFRFAHLSVREYLELSRNFNQVEANALVVQRCVDVYIFEQQDQSEMAMTQNNVLRYYARLYWPVHCQKLGSNPEEKVKNRIRRFLIRNGDFAPSFNNWMADVREAHRLSAWESSTRQLVTQYLSSPPSLLYLTCCLGLGWFMQDLDQLEHVSWNQRNLRKNTGLGLAARRSNEEVVRLLLQHDKVDVNRRNRDGRTALSLAAKEGHESVVRLLLERNDITADVLDGHDQTPLLLVAQRGHDAVVRMLLEREDVDVDCKDRYGMTPRAWASQNGHTEVVRLLDLENPKPPDLEVQSFAEEECAPFPSGIVRKKK